LQLIAIERIERRLKEKFTMMEPTPDQIEQTPADVEANKATAAMAESARTTSEELLIEPYSSLEEIVGLHPLSKIDMGNLEHSSGLRSEEALKRLSIYGKNVLTPPPKIPEWKRFLQQFQNLFLILLMLSSALSFVAYFIIGGSTNLYLGIVLITVVFLTGLLQFHEEGKALQVMDSFKNLLATDCTVYRDGRNKRVDVAELVPGDLVLVSNGEKIPADLVLLMCRGLKVECSSLTGESEPISCSDQPSAKGTRKFECKNLVFNGSLCYDGMAIGLVISTGDKTAIGTIAKLAADTKTRESVLQREVRNFVKLVGIIALAMASVSFVIAVILQGANTTEAVFTLFINGFLTILVANVPQGLPSTVVSLLSLAARRMALRSVLVKRIDCVETLGSCSIICSDKTGTLTKNEMTVTDIWFNLQFLRRVKTMKASVFSQEPQALLFRAGILCNRAEPIAEQEVAAKGDSIRDVQMKHLSNVSRLSWASSARKSMRNIEEMNLPLFRGNPSDVAILTYCEGFVPVGQLRKECPILVEVPFNSTNKYQVVVTKLKSDKGNADAKGDVEYEVLMKGAPEVILTRCTSYATSHGTNYETEITEAFRQEFTTAYERFASQGRRVLALCSKPFHAPEGAPLIADDNSYNFPTTGLKFIGLVAIMDPPRDNVPDAIAKCLSAGVKVFMVTGDHPFTARAIAREIGLLKSDNNIELLENVTTTSKDWESCDGAVIHGCRIDELTDDQWRIILAKDGGVCFCRTTPAHKLLIVQQCQTLMGEVVAVTGDGVNDSPALKQADIGIASTWQKRIECLPAKAYLTSVLHLLR
jgi:sodium/potassium-transporting ATPase subunit alpha